MTRAANNLDALRLLFALLVVFSHSYALAGRTEPVLWVSTLGTIAVHGFFVISGYLITQSFQRSRSLTEFVANRVLRLAPALIVATVVATVLAALAHGYVANPIPYITNGPVWTLTWEVVCYAGVAVLGLCGVLDRRAFPAFFASAWLVFLASSSEQSDFRAAVVPMLLMFGAGALIALGMPRIRRDVLALAAVGLLATASFPVFEAGLRAVVGWIPFLWGPVVSTGQVHQVVYLLTFPIVVIWLGVGARAVPGPRADVSYGVYVYAWPVAQVVVFLGLRIGWRIDPVSLFVLTLAGTLPLAYLSWRFIEAPALSLKRLLRRLPAVVDVSTAAGTVKAQEQPIVTTAPVVAATSTPAPIDEAPEFERPRA